MIQYIQAKKFPLELFILLISVLLFVPSILIHSDVGASGFVPEDFLFLWLICFGGLLASAALSWLLPRFSTLIHRAAGALALYILVTSIFYPIQSGVLDGREASSISLWDIHTHLILALICFLTYWHSIKVAPKVLAILGCLAFLFSGYVTFYELGKLGKRPDAAQLMELGTDENIIVLVLDTLHGLLAKQLLEEEPRFQNELDGFTFYENTFSGAQHTELSTVALLRGSLPEVGEEKKPRDAIPKNDNLLTDLQKMSFTVSCFNTPNPSAPSLYAGHLLNLPDLFHTLSLGTIRYMGFVIHAALGFARELGLTGNSAEKLALEYFAQNLKVSPSVKKKAIYYHSYMTHVPVCFDRQGEYHDNLQMIHLKDQLYFGMTLAVEMIRTLKTSGMYDKTTIVIAGDHGTGIYGQNAEMNKQLYRRVGTSNSSYTSFDVALLIKPQGAKGSLQVSPIPQTLTDIRKTLATLVGVADKDLDLIPGQNIFQNDQMERNIDILALKPTVNWEAYVVTNLEPWLKTTITLPYR